MRSGLFCGMRGGMYGGMRVGARSGICAVVYAPECAGREMQPYREVSNLRVLNGLLMARLEDESHPSAEP